MKRRSFLRFLPFIPAAAKVAVQPSKVYTPEFTLGGIRRADYALATLHGRERVIPLDEMQPLASGFATVWQHPPFAWRCACGATREGGLVQMGEPCPSCGEGPR